MLRYRGHIGWNSWKIIPRLISLTYSLSADHSMTDLLQSPKVTSPNFSRNTYAVGSGRIKLAISPKRLKIERKLLLKAYIKSYSGFRLPTKCMTLNNLWARFKVTYSLNAAKNDEIHISNDCVPQTDTSSSYVAVDSTHTAVGRFRSLVRRYGTRCPTISEIRRVVLTVLSSFLRQSCLVFTNVTSALEVF